MAPVLHHFFQATLFLEIFLCTVCANAPSGSKEAPLSPGHDVAQHGSHPSSSEERHSDLVGDHEAKHAPVESAQLVKAVQAHQVKKEASIKVEHADDPGRTSSAIQAGAAASAAVGASRNHSKPAPLSARRAARVAAAGTTSGTERWKAPLKSSTSARRTAPHYRAVEARLTPANADGSRIAPGQSVPAARTLGDSLMDSMSEMVRRHLEKIPLEQVNQEALEEARKNDGDETKAWWNLNGRLNLNTKYFFKCATAAIVAFITVVGVIVWQTKYKGRSINIIKFLPCLSWVIPESMHKVQDLDHLTLILLFLGAVATCFMMVVNMTKGGYILEIIGLLVLIPVLAVVIQCIGSYDNKFLTKRQEVQRKKEQISEVYVTMLDDMEKKLAEASESNAGMVENKFQSKKQDFCRFLGWLSDARLPEGGGDTFRSLLVQWLRVFAETSLDPVDKPRIGSETPFLTLADVPGNKVCSSMPVLQAALKGENVRFIEAETEAVKDKKDKMKKRQEADEKRREAMNTWQEDMRKQDPSWWSSHTTEFIGISRGPEEVASADDVDSTYPFKICLGKCSLKVWSGMHMTIIIGLIASPLLCIAFIADTMTRFDSTEDAEHVTIQFGMIAVFCCCVIILRHYERIDVVLKLETEIQNIQQERIELEEQSSSVSMFFGKTQTLVDFWTYRTSPLLDLHHELHERIKDEFRNANAAEIIGLVEHAVENLDEIRQRVDAPECWLMTISDDARSKAKEEEVSVEPTNELPRSPRSPASPSGHESPYKTLFDWVRKVTKGDSMELNTILKAMDATMHSLTFEWLKYKSDLEEEGPGIVDSLVQQMTHFRDPGARKSQKTVRYVVPSTPAAARPTGNDLEPGEGKSQKTIRYVVPSTPAAARPTGNNLETGGDRAGGTQPPKFGGGSEAGPPGGVKDTVAKVDGASKKI